MKLGEVCKTNGGTKSCKIITFVGFKKKVRTAVRDEQEEGSEEFHVDFIPMATCYTLTTFEEIRVNELVRVVKEMSSKSCDLDPIPTWLVKDSLEELAPILTSIINKSLLRSTVPDIMQKALVMPTIKNPNGDTDLFSNYRPVSNISFVSKVLEKVVLNQLNSYLWRNDLLNADQSGYRAGHSCETLLAGMFDDL
eukprot:sb/3470924/